MTSETPRVDMKDIFNVGCIMVIAGIIANVLKGIGPPMFRALDIEAQTAGILIIIYTLIKFYKTGVQTPGLKRAGEVMTKTGEWAIMDSAGIIFSGTEEEIRERWNDPDEIYMHNTISGDLLLIEIHERVK